MPILNAFERKVLFRFTRGLAIFLITLVLLGLAGMAAWALLHQAPGSSKEVSAKSLMAELKESRESRQKTGGSRSTDPAMVLDPMAGLAIPSAFQEILDAAPGNRAFFAKEFGDLTKKERQIYANNLAEVWMAGKKENFSINETVLAFVMERRRLEGENTKAEAEAKASREVFRWGALAAVFSIALYSLVLVLLAIERNTRPAEI